MFQYMMVDLYIIVQLGIYYSEVLRVTKGVIYIGDVNAEYEEG